MAHKIELNLVITPAMREVIEHPARYKFVKKGRRSGFTHNMCNWLIEASFLEKYSRILWVDTNYAQIGNYINNFIKPVLDPLPKQLWNYNKSTQTIDLFNTRINFKSAENISGIEGLGFDLIVVNECGFLYKTKDLFEHTLLPMTIDTKGSIISGGTPKNSAGTWYEEIWNKSKSKKLEEYASFFITAFDNPFSDPLEIEKFINTADKKSVEQEIFGKFISLGGENFFHEFDRELHVSKEAEYDPSKRIAISFDFNVGYMAAIMYYKTRDKMVIFDEVKCETQGCDIIDICNTILKKINKHDNMKISHVTGDASGVNRSGLDKNRNYYTVIKKYLPVTQGQIKLRNKNPYLLDSAVMCNFALRSYDIQINQRCEELIKDLSTLKMLKDGSIDKSNAARSHWGDAFRYACHLELEKWFNKMRL